MIGSDLVMYEEEFKLIDAELQRLLPATAVAGDIVQVVAETNEAHVSGVAALYHPEKVPLPLRARAGEIGPLDWRGTVGTAKRESWDDGLDCVWQNLALPAATVQLFRFDKSLSLDSPVSVQGRFGRQGFEGRLRGKPWLKEIGK